MIWPYQAVTGNGAITIPFHTGRLWRAVPERALASTGRMKSFNLFLLPLRFPRIYWTFAKIPPIV